MSNQPITGGKSTKKNPEHDFKLFRVNNSTNIIIGLFYQLGVGVEKDLATNLWYTQQQLHILH